MSKQKQPSLSMNLIMNIILTVSGFVFPLIAFPYISRVLLAEGIGKVQLASSFISYFTIISQLGIPTYGIRACAAVRDDRTKLTRTVHELMMIQAVATLISYALLIGFILSVPRLYQERQLYFITSLTILLGAIGMEWLFRAMEQYTYITIRSLVFKVIAIIAMFLLVKSKQDYVIYATISVVAAAGSNILNLTQLRKFIDLKPVGGYQLRQHLRPVFVLFAYVCATTIYTNLDTVMLGFMATDAEVGYYGVAVKLKNILVSVVTALGTVLLPRVSYYYEQRLMDDFWKIAAKAFRVVLMMALPLTVYFMVLAKDGIFFLSGTSYERSVLPMIIIMPTLVCIGLTSVTGNQILIPTKRENTILHASLVGALIDLILNAILIPDMGAAGAAIGTLVAEAVVLLYHFAVLRREIKAMLCNMKLWSVLLATGLASAASFWVVSLGLSEFFALAFSAVLFFGTYLLVLLVAKDPVVMEIKGKMRSFVCKNRPQ